MPDIRLIALDLDGTLLDSAKNLSERNRNTLAAAAAKGVHVVPTTGRFFGMMPEAIRALPFVRYAITVNGAQVYDRETDSALARAEIPVAIAIAASLCYIYYNDLVQQDIQAALVANQAAISRMQSHIITGLASLIENRDVETGEHVLRTGIFVEMLTRDAIKDGIYRDQLNEQFVSKMTTLAPMHDIGKIVVSDKILRKPGRLTPEEYEQMKKHAAVGGDVIREVLEGVTNDDYLSFASDIATYHHERWDGKGYPKGLKGEQIPLAARIMAIADVFDALVSQRCYKEPFSFDESVKIIEEGAGTQFDPNLVGVFLRHRSEFR